MDDYDRARRDDDRDRPDDSSGGFQLPGGISPQAAATALLVVVVGAILFILFVPESDDPPDLATPTPGAASADGDVVGTPVAIGSPNATSDTAEGTEGAAAGSTVPAAGAAVTLAAGGTPGAPALTPASGATAASQVTDTVGSAALATGGYVKISGTGPDGARYRYGPGLDYVTIRIVPEGEVMRVAGGPEEADGFTWWRLGDQLGNIGWAAEQFLSTAPAPTVWNPPAASPTFEAGSEAAEATAAAP